MGVVGVGTLGNLEEDRELKVRYVVLRIVDYIACMSLYFVHRGYAEEGFSMHSGSPEKRSECSCLTF
jgi:hypothetical protein